MTSFATLTAIATPGLGPAASDLSSGGAHDAGNDFSDLLARAQDEEEARSGSSQEPSAPPPATPLPLAPQPLHPPVATETRTVAEAQAPQEEVPQPSLDAAAGQQTAEFAETGNSLAPQQTFPVRSQTEQASQSKTDSTDAEQVQARPLASNLGEQPAAHQAGDTPISANLAVKPTAKEAQAPVAVHALQTAEVERTDAPLQTQDHTGAKPAAAALVTRTDLQSKPAPAHSDAQLIQPLDKADRGQAIANLGTETQDQAAPAAAPMSDASQARRDAQPQTLPPPATAPQNVQPEKAEGLRIQDALARLGEDAALDLEVTTKTQAAPTPPATAAAYLARLNNPPAGSLQNLPTQPVETPRQLRAEALRDFASPEDHASSLSANLDEAAVPSKSLSLTTNSGSYSLATALQAQLQGQSTGQQTLGASLDTSVQAFDLSSLEGGEAGQIMTAQSDTASAVPQSSNASPLSGLAKATIETTAQISAQILRKLEGRSTRFDMTLTPESLGRVDVSLTIEADGQVAARLAFDNPAAASEMRGRVDELRRQLADAGLTLTRDNLEFTERNPQSGSGNGGFDHHQDRRAFAGAARLNQEADLASLPVPAPWAVSSQTPDRVDVKV